MEGSVEEVKGEAYHWLRKPCGCSVSRKKKMGVEEVVVVVEEDIVLLRNIVNGAVRLSCFVEGFV